MRTHLARDQRARTGVTLLFLANGAGFGAWAASVPGIKERLTASDGALGAALLCGALGAMLAMPIIGWLGAHRVPHLLNWTALALTGALPLPGLIGSIPSLAGALLVMGAAAGALDVGMNARASQIEQDWGAPIMSSFHAAFSLGGLLGAGLEALSVWLGWGVVGGLLLTSLLLAATAASYGVLDRRPDLATTDPGARFSWPSPAIAGIGLLCSLAFMTEGAVGDWSGVFLRSVGGFSAPAAASGYAAFSAAMVLARMLGDLTVRRLGPGRALWSGALLAGAGVALAVAAPAAGPVGFAMVGLGIANFAPVFFSVAGSTSSSASAGIAAVATLGYGGLLLGPPLIGALADAVGLRFALCVLIAAMAAIGLGARRIVR